MKIRAILQLSEFLDNDLGTRKRELTSARFMALRARKSEESLVRRAATCMLYAHWEGFVRTAVECYMSYVSLQGLRYRDLAANILAVCVRSQLRSGELHARLQAQTDFISSLIIESQEKPLIPSSWLFDVGSNLNSDRLKDVLCLIGTSDVSYAPKYAVIDGKILFYRNSIAHGELVDVDQESYDVMHDVVLELLDTIRTDVENSALMKLYLRSP
jgi:hypothetical protein